jgi:hypothetical protein
MNNIMSEVIISEMMTAGRVVSKRAGFCGSARPKSPCNRLDLHPKGYEREALPRPAIRRPR